MSKKDKGGKSATNANTLEQSTGDTPADPNANGSATIIDPEAEKKKEERRAARAEQIAGQEQTARSFKSLAALVTAHLTAGNLLYGEKDGTESNIEGVFEIINAGDRALAVGFPGLDKPKVTRGASISDLKEQYSQATQRLIAKEITEDEYREIGYTIEGKIRRLQAAEKKKAEAEKAASEAAGASA